MDISALVKTGTSAVKMFWIQNNAEVMTGIAIVGVPVTAYFAGKAAIEADKKLQDIGEADLKTKAMAVAPIVVKPVVAGVATMGCVYGANNANARKIAALAGAYSMSEGTRKELKEKMHEVLGKKKASDIEEAIKIDEVQKNPPTEDKIINTGKGETLCYDRKSGTYFRSNKDAIDYAFEKLSNDILIDGYASWNDLLYIMGRPEMGAGEDLGWTDPVTVSYTSTLTDGFEPVLVVDYDLPHPNFFSEL